jgi:hypothetical protein
MERIRGKYKRLNIDRKWIFLGLAILVASFFIDIRPVIFLAVFSAGNAIVLSIDRYVQAPLDIELSTFSAVLMTTVFGLKWGIAAAVITKLAAIAYNRNIRVDHLFMIGGYVLAAFFASLFQMNIMVLGLIVTFLVNIYVLFISKFVTMLSDYEIIMYGSSNFIFNAVLFIGFSEFLQKILLL